MFRAIILPILRSTRLCLQLVVQCTEEVACNTLSFLSLIHCRDCHQQATSSVHCTTSLILVITKPNAQILV